MYSKEGLVGSHGMRFLLNDTNNTNEVQLHTVVKPNQTRDYMRRPTALVFPFEGAVSL